MNNGEYKLANSDKYDTSYGADREYFDVYSKPIKTLYSQVHWTSHGDIPLPESIIERFSGNGKIMAITGYEVDQVMETGNEEKEVLVPITWAYNHHYGAYLSNSKKIQLVKKKGQRQGLHHGADDDYYWTGENIGDVVDDDDDNDEIPQLQFFSEGNGGEMRMSYHGYPKGYAQLIESPDTFHVTPMQIDTWNRNMKNSTFLPGPLPKNSQFSDSGKTAGYNRLLECPCSDRLPKEWHMTYTFVDDDDRTKCTNDIVNADECLVATKQLMPSDQTYDTKTVFDKSLPLGCSATMNDKGQVRAIWNTAASESTTYNVALDKDAGEDRVVGVAMSVLNVTVSIANDENTQANKDAAVQIKMAGPADKWLGVGLGSDSMCLHKESDECPTGGPYAIVAIGETVVEERKLDYHGPGVVLTNSTLTVVSNQVENGIRTIHLTRPLTGPSESYYKFDPTVSAVPLIMATGCDNKAFSQHCGHGSTQLNLLPVNKPKQICEAGIEGSIGGNKFNNHRCAAFPHSDLVDQNNPTCRVETYKGGLRCCRHGQSLLDKDQEIPWSDTPIEYYLKFRFYFEEFQKKPSSLPLNHPEESSSSLEASHKQLVRLYWQTEAFAGEYDIVPCERQNGDVPSEECVQVITSRWKVREMLHDCSTNDASWCTGTNSTKADGIKLIYAGPHCHAATCLSMDLYNADTGRLLCHMEPIYGQGEHHKQYDESNYLAIPPCLWSEDDSGLLQQPELLSLDTTLLSIKRNNNTIPHTGEMASWQMRGILVYNKNHKKNKNDETTLSDNDSLTGMEQEGSHLQQRPLLRSTSLVLQEKHTTATSTATRKEIWD